MGRNEIINGSFQYYKHVISIINSCHVSVWLLHMEEKIFAYVSLPLQQWNRTVKLKALRLSMFGKFTRWKYSLRVSGERCCGVPQVTWASQRPNTTLRLVNMSFFKYDRKDVESDSFFRAEYQNTEKCGLEGCWGLLYGRVEMMRLWNAGKCQEFQESESQVEIAWELVISY